MARIPLAVATPGSLGVDTPTRSLTGSALPPDQTGDAIQAVGRSLMQAGAVAGAISSQYKTEREQKDEYETLSRFTVWRQGQQQAFEDATRSQSLETPPDGFSRTITESYDKSAREFLAGVPEHLKGKFDQRLLQERDRFSGAATTFERSAAESYHGRAVTSVLDGLRKSIDATPGDAGSYLQDGLTVIDNAPLSPETRLKLRQEWERNGRISAIEGTFKRDPAILTRQSRSAGATPSFAPDVNAAIDDAAAAAGVDSDTLRRFAKIESSGRPGVVTGSYKGLFQLSDEEFAKHGGGDIFNARDNALAAARKLKAESAEFEAKYGRTPTAGDIYMLHQQGAGGYANHMANPSAPAWQNMAETAEGRRKGEGWAKQAIWGNLPPDARARFGSVDNVTSAEFTQYWKARVEGGGRFGGSDTVAAAERAGGGARSRSANVPADGPGPSEGPSLYDMPEFQALKFEEQQAVIDKLERENGERIRREKAQAAEEKAQAAASRGAEKERLELAIEVGEVRDPRTILQNQMIDNGDKAMLLRRVDEKNKEFRGVESLLATMESGGVLNQFDPETKKAADKLHETVAKKLSSTLPPAEAAARLVAYENDFIGKTGIVPVDVARGIRGGLASGKVDQVTAALDRADRIMSIRDNPFDGQDGGTEIERAALAYRRQVELGDSKEKAVNDFLMRQTPEFKRAADVRRREVQALLKNRTIGEVTDKFDTWLSFEPGAGPTANESAIMADYRELFAEAYADNGNEDTARSVALGQIKKLYGVSELTGSKMVMRNPPEAKFPAVGGSHQYITDQAIETIKTATGAVVDKGKLAFLPVTLPSGQAPGYRVLYQDEDAVWHEVPAPPGQVWRPDPKAVMDKLAAEARTTGEAARENAPFGTVNRRADVRALAESYGVLPREDLMGGTGAQPMPETVPMQSGPPRRGSSPTRAAQPAGMLEPGNIDIDKRKTLRNEDGSISTERSMSVNLDGVEVLIPTVSHDGKRILSDDEAVAQYQQSGLHLGKFTTPQAADAYAQSLHKRQEKAYIKPGNSPFGRGAF